MTGGGRVLGGVIAAVLSAGVIAGCGGKTYTVPNAAMEPTLKIHSLISVGGAKSHYALGQIVAFHPPRDAVNLTGPSDCGVASQGISNSSASPDPQPCDAPGGGEDTQLLYLKRVVGLPGDTLKISMGRVYRNGALESEPYIGSCGQSVGCTFSRSIIVPAGDYYVMGDNRGDSLDSRFYGPIPVKWISGPITSCSDATKYCTSG